MRTFGSIVLMVLSVLMFLAVIAAMQYGYHHGPTWLYRCDNGDPTFFTIATGFTAMIAAIAGCGFAGHCMTQGPKQ